MNLQLQPRTDLVPWHPHPVCALRDLHTLHPRLTTRSTDMTRSIGGHQPPRQKLSEHHNTRIPGRHTQLKPIQLP
jgi:hypothetical protein